MTAATTAASVSNRPAYLPAQRTTAPGHRVGPARRDAAAPDQAAPDQAAPDQAAPDPATPDEALLERLSAGDADAWDAVVRRYLPVVRGAARRVLADSSDVDEATQRTWLALWRFAGSIRDASRLPGWLAITARREALAMVRPRRREVLVADAGDIDPGSFPDSSAMVEQAERARYLRAAVDRLPQRQRQLMLQLLADRSSYDELSRTLNMPRGSIGPMRARAIRSLRMMLWPLDPAAG